MLETLIYKMAVPEKIHTRDIKASNFDRFGKDGPCRKAVAVPMLPGMVEHRLDRAKNNAWKRTEERDYQRVEQTCQSPQSSRLVYYLIPVV